MQYRFISAYLSCPEVITGAINIELVTNICCTIYQMKYICPINIACVDEALELGSTVQKVNRYIE